MKKIKLFFFAFMAMFLLSAHSLWADTAFVKVTANDNTVSWVEIQGTIDGNNFSVGSNAIHYSTSGAIDLSEVWSGTEGTGTQYQVTSIGEYAFWSCENITTVVLPEGVTYIGQWAFVWCKSLKSLEIPESVTNIGTYAFQDCNGTNFIIHNTNMQYGDAFNSCQNYTVTIPEGVKSIGENAFYNCEGMAAVELPSTLESIGNSAFHYCKGLTEVNIPASVTSIGENAFESCGNLTSIQIPDDLSEIGNHAFADCSSLTSVKLPSALTSIGDGVFSSSGLTSIELPASVTSIGNYAFSSCYGLTELTIPANVTTIGDDAFNNCENLANVVLTEGVTNIGQWAFAWCKSLKSLEIPESVTSIGYYAFQDCDGTNFIIHNTNMQYGNAFNSCQNYTVTIPEGVKSIGEDAFYYCEGMAAVELPSTLESIGNNAFYYCKGLTEVNIPASVTSIGNEAFSGCDNLVIVNSLIPVPFVISENTFSNYDATLNIPDGTYDTYMKTSAWNKFKNIAETFFTLTVSDAELATMYVDYPLDVLENENIKGVYYGKEIINGELQLAEITDVIPANTGVIVSAAPGTYTFFRSTEEGTAITDNLLQGSVEEQRVDEIDGKVLTLGHGYASEKVGFYKYEGGWLAAHKAYIVLPASSDVKELGIAFDGNATSITAIENETEKAAIYDVMGRKVMNEAGAKLPKGLYIVNGKKVLVK